MSAAPSAAKIVKAFVEGGASAVAVLCAPLDDAALARVTKGLDGRAFAPWQQTKPTAQYARCGSCGALHHFGLATAAHTAKHTRERAARGILEGEALRRRELAAQGGAS